MPGTTLFVADDAECARLFVAVRRPLAQPITRVGFNPLTRQLLGGASWDPGEGGLDRVTPLPPSAPSEEPPPPSWRRPQEAVAALSDPTDAPPVPPIVAPASDAERALEEAAPPRLRALPHAVVRGVTGFELEALGIVLVGRALPPARIVEPGPRDGFVDALPEAVVRPLAELEDAALAGTLALWNAQLAPTRRRVSARALEVVRALAREAGRRGANVFVHMPRPA